jgi:hypothetical protein
VRTVWLTRSKHAWTLNLASPYHIYEIERGSHGALAKSLQSLQLAHELFNARITLVVHSSNAETVRQRVPIRIARELKLCTIEACLGCTGSPVKLAQVLGLEVGARR